MLAERPGDAEAAHGERRPQPAVLADARHERELQPHARRRTGFRGRNINAPLDGVRPDPTVGNVTQVESTANMRGQTFIAGVNFQHPGTADVPLRQLRVAEPAERRGRRVQPAGQQLRPGRRMGPVAGVPRHIASAMFNTPLIKSIRLGADGSVREPARPTTSRPAATTTATRCSTIVPAASAATARAREIELGRRRAPELRLRLRPAPPAAAAARGGQPVMIVQRVGGGGGGGDIGGIVRRRRRRQAHPLRAVRVGVEPVQPVNPIGYSGVMTSPFFGQPTAAMPARKIDVGMRDGVLSTMPARHGYMVQEHRKTSSLDLVQLRLAAPSRRR